MDQFSFPFLLTFPRLGSWVVHTAAAFVLALTAAYRLDRQLYRLHRCHWNVQFRHPPNVQIEFAKAPPEPYWHESLRTHAPPRVAKSQGPDSNPDWLLVSESSVSRSTPTSAVLVELPRTSTFPFLRIPLRLFASAPSAPCYTLSSFATRPFSTNSLGCSFDSPSVPAIPSVDLSLFFLSQHKVKVNASCVQCGC